MKLSLVVLAAGMGSRYGDAKQIAGVGPGGEWLLEYALHDALAAGFTEVLIVIRPTLEAPLRERLAPVVQDHAALHFVTQAIQHVPDGCCAPQGRAKPLGTGHALWCCAPLLHGPFAVINADDYYGQHAFTLLAGHFRSAANPAMVGYELAATLSANGSVNRGVCAIDTHGHLERVSEFLDISRCADSISGTAPDGARRPLQPDTTVSLNCWGLLPDLLPGLETGLRAFLAHAGAKDEYFLPAAISVHLAASQQPLSVLPTPDRWLGLTYPGDRAEATRALAALHAAGVYATPLWSAA